MLGRWHTGNQVVIGSRKLTAGWDKPMNDCRIQSTNYFLATLAIACLLVAGSATAQQDGPGDNRMDADKARVIDHWTQERREAASPRELVIDPRGLGYLRRPDGSLQPYGHQISAAESAGEPTPRARPTGGSDDTAPPSIGNMNPGLGDEIGGSATFSATVTDESGVRSVSFIIRYPDGVTTQAFQATDQGNDNWSVILQGFTDGNWSWWVEARDGAKRGGNSDTSAIVDFSVNTGGNAGGGGENESSYVVTSDEWTAGGEVQTATGRLYFEMPNNAKRKGPWLAYVCSGTAVIDVLDGRSLILTAAHCVYDDVNKAFSRNVLFIPNQAATSGSGTDTNCNNDLLGCWAPSYGVVDQNWRTTTFPGNIDWDYAFYVVDDSGAHAGPGNDDALDSAVIALDINFSTPYVDDGVAAANSVDFTHGLGYSYSEDPELMYCAEDMTTEGAVNWWLPSCLLSGGSSGGPWVQPMDEDTGSGSVISVNSWGYSSSSGMAGPKLVGTSASCVYGHASSGSPPVSNADGEAGTAVSCP